MLAREVEWELAPACQFNGLGLLPWSPLAGGVLTGKYRRGAEPTEEQRLSDERMARIFGVRTTEERTWNVLGVLKEVAARRDATIAQVALAWVAAQPAVSSVILGARTLGQLAGNLCAAELALNPGEVEQLAAVSEPAVDYPYGGLAVRQRTRRVEGGWHH